MSAALPYTVYVTKTTRKFSEPCSDHFSVTLQSSTNMDNKLITLLICCFINEIWRALLLSFDHQLLCAQSANVNLPLKNILGDMGRSTTHGCMSTLLKLRDNLFSMFSPIYVLWFLLFWILTFFVTSPTMPV